MQYLSVNRYRLQKVQLQVDDAKKSLNQELEVAYIAE